MKFMSRDASQAKLNTETEIKRRRSSYKERKGNALALGADEGRG